MDNYKIEFSKDARNDFKNIIHYVKYKLQEPNTANKLSAKVKEKINGLSHSPYLFAIIDDEHIKKLEIRKLVVNHYIVFYRVLEESKKVQIVRILYGRRNWIKLL